MTRIEPVFLFDLDGTLVDSVYQHVLSWQDALDAAGIELSVWRIHRKIGMSGGLFANMLLRETGLEASPELLERLRNGHRDAYRTRLTPPTVKVQEFPLLAPGLRFAGTRSTRACLNSPKPVTSRCAGPAGPEFATPASPG